MNIFKKYNTSDYYYAEIHQISKSYPKYINEVETDIMHYNDLGTYRTILLKIGEEYIDLLHTTRKIVTERDNTVDCNVIRWKYSLNDDVIKSSFNLPSSMNVISALRVAYKNNILLDKIGLLLSVLDEQNKSYECDVIRAR